MHNFAQMHDRVWYLSVPKSFFEDGISAGPFEFLTAISFSFEYLLTNLLFVPFMSGASFNGDLATMTFGFSAQSDESRHMTLGLEVIKFMLEQDEGNVPIVQDWVDKWFWRGYRLLGLVAAMMDYMLPKKIMSWKEAFELYLEKQMLEGLFPDLEYYGIRPPRHIQQAIAEKEYMSHQVYWILYQFSPRGELQHHRAAARGARLDVAGLPGHLRPALPAAVGARPQASRSRASASSSRACRCCARSARSRWASPSRATRPRSASGTSEFSGERFNFCSDGCKWIFDREPEKYVQAWLPVHQIYQGNCGGTSIPEVLDWYGIRDGVDNGEYLTSPDKINWDKWHSGCPWSGGW